jgi:hypothetical protein
MDASGWETAMDRCFGRSVDQWISGTLARWSWWSRWMALYRTAGGRGQAERGVIFGQTGVIFGPYDRLLDAGRVPRYPESQ